MVLRRLLVLLLLPALLLAQSLGLVHGVAHAPGLAVSGAAVAADIDTSHAQAAQADGLFGGHDGSTCRLYDQLTHGSAAPCVPVVLAPLLPPAQLVAVLHGLALARWAALFDARGPPALR
ncbi:MAG TPA: hypothetical protein VFE82_17175 [Ramlibacter sp.]|jgi:hypothetical protein|uniref:hypothetical protein n=1 Tax=Ramlibacter sp. TaxID=1917967 RepID=UPI002D75B325|nr:hypothetical protein [Ramlibacter sp.]HZY20205.1 hypothetical protein [Ramlibacter sp.]